MVVGRRRGAAGADGGGAAGVAGGTDDAAGEAPSVTDVARRAPESVDLSEGVETNAETSADAPAGRETSGEAARGDEVSGEVPARSLPARNTDSIDTQSPAETRTASRPRLATSVKPDYPFRARRLGHEGTVAFTVLVGAGGSVVDIMLDESSGHAELDKAARAAVRHASYVPGSSGRPMPVRVRVVFRLEDGFSGS